MMRIFPSTAESVRVWHRLLRLVFVPLGIALLVYGVWGSVSFLRVAVAAEGTVVALVEQRDEKSRVYYYPRIHYSTRNGYVAESIAPAGSFPAAFSVGEKVSILYDPQELSRIRINRISDLWGFTIVCAFGVVLSLIWYLALGRYEKRLTTRAPLEGTEQTAESERVWHRLLRLVFVPLGIALLVYSVWWSASFLCVAVAAEGTVVALVEQRDEKSRVYYYPRIHYSTRNGNVAESIAPAGSFPAAFSVGEKVSILYEPQKLSRIRINRISDLWGFTIVCAFGVVLSLIWYLALGRYEKRLTTRAPLEGTEQVDEPNGAPPRRLS